MSASAAIATALVAAAACSIGGTGPELPVSARVRVEGTAPQPLKLIISTDFFEQLNLETNERIPIIQRADTIDITLPYDGTIDMASSFGTVYVQLYYEAVPTASVRMRVDLNTGQKYDQSATLSDHSSLVYYFIFA